MEWVEAYPGNRATPQANYRGPLTMYRAAGFELHRDAGTYQVMRKRLD